MELFRIQNLNFSYPEKSREALKDISLSIQKEEFIILCGQSGCGKTTLLRHFKTVLSPCGDKSGVIYYSGKPLQEWSNRSQSEKIGYVLQSPENQIVTDKVWHELAFGLECLGYEASSIHTRVAEVVSFLGIEDWFYKNVCTLSGGQKQLLNLASILVMQPEVLILDEPTSQLDPIAASEFLGTLVKINRELGITILLSEHRLDETLSYCDRLIVMDEGRIIADGAPEEVGTVLREQKHRMFFAMPVPMQVWAGVENAFPCPVTVQEGRRWLDRFSEIYGLNRVEPAPQCVEEAQDTLIEFKDIWFRYSKETGDILKGMSMKVSSGSITAILGGNGVGKTTMLSLVSGLLQPYRGKIMLEGQPLNPIQMNGSCQKIGVLPQNPQCLFLEKTLELDLLEVLDGNMLSKDEKLKQIQKVSLLCQIDGLLKSHPFDLSGGEMQRAALAKVLLTHPKILLLDEPTKGMDAFYKESFGEILKQLQASGTTILMVSHDVEFCAQYANMCALLFDGRIVSQGFPKQFFPGNSFYTTAANRMARHHLPDAVTAEDILFACGVEINQKTDLQAPVNIAQDPIQTKNTSRLRPFWLRGIGFMLGLSSLVCFILLISAATGDGSLFNLIESQGWQYTGALSLALVGIALGTQLVPRDSKQSDILVSCKISRKMSSRAIVATCFVLLLIPLTIMLGIYFLDDRKYYFISLLLILESMVPFALAFEGRKPQVRELVVLAVLCGIGVAGRAAFFWIPQFKPVVALIAIVGVSLGGEAGFLVGTMTGFLSGFFFGQGPWTPWQMFAFGLIGVISNVLARNKFIQFSRISFSLFGGIMAFIIYGGIMDTSTVLLMYDKPTFGMFLATYMLGLPFNLIHGIATVVFLLIAGPIMLEKLARLKSKYGLTE